MSVQFSHNPIMVSECLAALNIKQDGIYLDCTLGGGGHASHILSKLTTGKLIAIDKDEDAISFCSQKFSQEIEQGKLVIVKSDFKQAICVLDKLGIPNIDGIIIDLGVSSYQLDNFDRGFSYRSDSRLDMRMDKSQQLSAYEVVNTYTQEKLSEIIYKYSDEKFARKIAQNIVEQRQQASIETTNQLVEIIDRSIPYKFKRDGGHVAKRTFQAIRIEVNGELSDLDTIITALILRLKKDGRIAVLTFHSLEDRIVKQVFKQLATDCICDKSLPICVCHHKADIKLLSNKPIEASLDELQQNPRSQSAKLRSAQRI